MRWTVIEGNNDAEWRGITSSVVGRWLEWEIDRHPRAVRVAPTDSPEAVCVVAAGGVDWLTRIRRELRAAGIPPDRARRPADAPLVVAGGAVDATPLTALALADILCVGEAYRAVRSLLACPTPTAARRWARDSPHAIEASQVDGLTRAPDRPWLLRVRPPVLAEPDDYVDWDVPDVASQDDVVRIVASKGCHLKCSFCATTYRQTYRGRPGGLAARAAGHAVQGRRVQLLSNDPLALPEFRTVRAQVDNASLTSMELLDTENLLAIIRARPRVVRVGLEGVSERIRVAFGKAVPTARFIEQIRRLHAGGVGLTHSFWIVGAPYERPDDYTGWMDMWWRLLGAIRGLHRAKLTMFQPTPPAPLVRFLPATGTVPSRDALLDYAVRHREPFRHVAWSVGGPSALWRRRVCDMFGVSSLPFSEEATVDLMPTFDHFQRQPAEIVRWPIRPAVRWKVAETYRRRMTAA